MKGLVYSYSRISRLHQREGTGIERQIAKARKWAEEHGYVLDESLSMTDEGLSAYHGKHVKKGALGRFLRAIEDGLVPSGSVLAVESLDRLSRAEVMDAQAQFTSIINAGVSIATLLDNKLYSRQSIRANPLDLIMSILYMSRAHEESSTKSSRVRSSAKKRAEKWLAGTWRGRMRNGNEPGWVHWNGEAFELIPDRAEALRELIAMHLRGIGLSENARTMRERGLTVSGHPVSEQHVWRLVNHRALLGENVVSGEEDEAHADGAVRKVAYSYVLPDYYPPVITQEQWDDLQRVNAQRGRRFTKGTIPGVLTGIGVTRCGYCGQALVAQNDMRRLGKDGAEVMRNARRLRCVGLANGGCTIPGSTSVCNGRAVEVAVLAYCSDIANLRSLFSDDRTTAPRAALAKAQAKLAEIDKKLERFADAFFDAEDAPETIKRRAAMLETERGKLKQEVAGAERELADVSRSDVVNAHALWRKLTRGVLALDAESRHQARQLVADTFELIKVWHHGVEPDQNDDEHIDIVLHAKGGVPRALRIDRDGNLIAAFDEGAQAA